MSVFNLMRQQKDSMLRKHFFTRCMITKRISKKPCKFQNLSEIIFRSDAYCEVPTILFMIQSLNIWILICQLTHLSTNRQEFYYPAGRQPGAVILVQNSICYIICISKCRRTKYVESIFFKSRTITTKYFLHQRFASRRPWAAPFDL